MAKVLYVIALCLDEADLAAHEVTIRASAAAFGQSHQVPVASGDRALTAVELMMPAELVAALAVEAATHQDTPEE